MCQARNNPYEQQTNSFFLKFGQGIFFAETKKSIQDVIGDVYYPGCPNTTCVNFLTNKNSKFYDCKKSKACSHVLKIPKNDQKPTIILFSGDGTHCFGRKTGHNYEKEQPSLFEEIYPPITIEHTRT